MAWTCLKYHIVFSTKERRAWIDPKYLPRISEYMAGIVRRLGGHPIQFNGMEEHMHLSTSIPPTVAVANFVRDVKAGTSGWIHDTFPELRSFAWQDGYSAFTVSQSVLPAVVHCIQNQQDHHKKMSFVTELVELLTKHGVEFDPRFIQ